MKSERTYRRVSIEKTEQCPGVGRKVRPAAAGRYRLLMLAGIVVLVLLVLLSPLRRESPEPAEEENVSSADSRAETDSGKVQPTVSEGITGQAQPEKELTAEEIERRLLENPDHNTESLLRLLHSNEEAAAYLADYPEKYGTRLDCTLTDADLQKEDRLLPLFMQRDERWGYTEYGGYIFATNACGPTTLAMVAVGLTGNAQLDPRTVADFAEAGGYAAPNGQGSEWTLMSRGGVELGLNVRELYVEESMVRRALQAGHPVVCIMGPGHFTTGGHYIVICGEDENGFLINDCASFSRSAQHWAFEDFAEEIRCLWEFSYTE